MPNTLSRRRDSAALLLVLAAVGGGLGGCASASGVRLGATSYPARPVDHPVPVFEANAVPRAHDRIGRIVGEGSDLMSFAAIVEAMRGEARRLGGDGIVLLGGGLLVLGGDGEGEGIAVDRTVHGVVIRWR